MKSSIKLLLGAVLAAGLAPGIALAGSTQPPVDQATQKDLINKASAAGYTDVRNIIMEGEQYIADAKKNGKQVHLYLSKNGVVQTVKDGEHGKASPTQEAKQDKQR